MTTCVEITLSGLDYTVDSVWELDQVIEKAKLELRADIQAAKKAYRKANGVPEIVQWSHLDRYLEARKLLEDGASLGETARTVDVVHKTIKRWFPQSGWRTGGQSSAFIRKGDKAVERAVGAW